MSRNFRLPSRPWCGRVRSSPLPGAERRPGRVFLSARRPDRSGNEEPSAVGSAGRSCGATRQTVRAARSHTGACRGPETRAKACRSLRHSAPGAGSRPGSRIFQRSRRICAKRTRVRDRPWAWASRRPLLGSMSSPIRRSAFKRRPRAAATHGPSTAVKNQITPWSNDPVSDRPGEAFYLRDDETGDLWTPTALPIRDPAATYVARHGRGYSRFEHVAHEIASDLLQYVPVDDPIKISRLVLTNRSSRPRRLSVTAYVEWVLGSARSASLPFVSTEIDAATGRDVRPQSLEHRALARASPSRTCVGVQTRWTGDRREFIGRNGTLAEPAALSRRRRALQDSWRGPRSRARL